MKEIAIIGTTASGKTSLSLKIAHITNSIILSLDSLCVYKHIEIASAKPNASERGDIVHFGIDEVFPNEVFDVIKFIELYKKAKEFAIKHKKNFLDVFIWPSTISLQLTKKKKNKKQINYSSTMFEIAKQNRKE